MLGARWLGSYLSTGNRLAYNRPLLWLTFLSFPLPFIAIITGWFTAESAVSPGGLWSPTNANAMTPFLTTSEATISLVILLFGLRLHLPVWHVLHLPADPQRSCAKAARDSTSRGSEPADVAGRRGAYSRLSTSARENSPWHVLGLRFWPSAFLLYVLLDGVDLGVGLLFGLANGEARRGADAERRRADLDGNETWLVVTGGDSVGSFPLVYATLFSAFYLPLIVMLLGLILRGVAVRVSLQTNRLRLDLD